MARCETCAKDVDSATLRRIATELDGGVTHLRKKELAIELEDLAWDMKEKD